MLLLQFYLTRTNVGSELQAKDLQVSADNLNIKASTVTTDTALIDVKNIRLESGIDYKNREKQNKSKIEERDINERRYICFFR